MSPRTTSFAAALAATAALAACTRQIQTTTSAGEVSVAPAAPGQAVVTLAPQSGASVSGMATVVPGTVSDQTRIMINLNNAEANSVHPWHVHYGTCGNDQGIVGPPSAYPSLTAGLDGRAALTAVLPFSLPPSGQYMLNVHKSPAEMGTIVACGNLTTGTSATPR